MKKKNQEGETKFKKRDETEMEKQYWLCVLILSVDLYFFVFFSLGFV